RVTRVFRSLARWYLARILVASGNREFYDRVIELLESAHEDSPVPDEVAARLAAVYAERWAFGPARDPEDPRRALTWARRARKEVEERIELSATNTLRPLKDLYAPVHPVLGVNLDAQRQQVLHR